MSSPQEPEKYSIDDMMERLHQRSSQHGAEEDEGVLVTRADGSQAIKVRKRKRRTRQPHKEQIETSRRTRMIQVTLVLLVVLLAVFGSGVALVYANSAPFREGLIRMIEAKTGGKVRLAQFRMTPVRAHAGQIQVDWPEGGILRELSCRGVKAEISPSSFLGKSMRGEELTSPEATLLLSLPEPSANQPVERSAGEVGEVYFKSLSCPNLTVIMGEKAFPTVRLGKTEASFLQETSKGTPQLRLNRGELTLPGWPKLLLDRSHIEFRGSEVDVVSMRLRASKDSLGSFDLFGTIAPYDRSRPSVMAVQLRSFPLAGLIGQDWGRMFDGQVDTKETAKSNYLSIEGTPDLRGAFEVTFAGSAATPFEVSRFPFLGALAQITDDEWYERPRFESTVSGVLRRTDGGVVFDKLDLTDKSRIAVRGRVSSGADLKLIGKLQLGLTEAVITSSKNPRMNAIFGAPQEGFRWLDLEISGTVMNPADNFRQLYEGAPGTAAPAPGKKDGAPPSFEDLTNPGSGR